MTVADTVGAESLQEVAHRHLLLHFTRNGAFGPDAKPLLVLERGEGCYVFDATGRRYLGHRAQGSDVVLFLRETANDDVGTAAYLCAGSSTYLSHQGERPIAITWQLARAMPEPAFRVASVVGS